MQRLSRQQLVILVLLTLIWGFNWPVMKVGVSNYPPLSFRALTLVLALPLLALALQVLKLPFRVPRRCWPELFWLTATNLLLWNICMVIALRSLTSGRAAILGYTAPIFSAMLGALLFSTRLGTRGWLGVSAAAVGVTLLLWHEIAVLAGRPLGVVLALLSAATWALGTQLLRRSRINLPTLTLTFWMTAITGVIVSLVAWLFEREQWHPPGPAAGWAIAYNVVLAFGFGQAAWTSLARDLPPVASTLSVMLIPVLGVFSGALWLGEVLHWQDWAAVLLLTLAIGSVLWPASTVTTDGSPQAR